MQIDRAIEEVLETGSKRIGLLGFSFKAGTDDLRESPIVEVIGSFGALAFVASRAGDVILTADNSIGTVFTLH